MQHYDLIIIGNGLAGASMAQALKHLPLSIAIIDRASSTNGELINDNTLNTRPITLNHTSVNVLKTLNIWSKLTEASIAIEQLIITEQSRLGQIALSAASMRLDALAHVVPYADLESQLHNTSDNQLAIEHLTSTKLIAIENSDSIVTVCYQDEEQHRHQLSTSLLIAADGTQSPTKELLGIKGETTDHGDHALVFELQLQQPSRQPNTAFQRFTKHGTIAWLPGWQPDTARAVWTVPQAFALTLMNWSDDQFKQHLNQSYSSRQPTIQSLQLINRYPVMTNSLPSCCQQSVVFLGNAAHTFYPITAQGFNLTLLNVAMLAEKLTDNYNLHGQINHSSGLISYNHWSQSAQQQVAKSTQRIHQLFHTPLIGHLRSLGMLAVNLNPSLKKSILKPFLGYQSSQPKLACQIPLSTSTCIARQTETI